MDRPTWLKEKRRRAEERMDTLNAPIYHENWGAIDPTHQEMLDRFLKLCAPGGTILDAACGTGKYWSSVLASGRTLHGIDQSRQMLLRARAKFPNVLAEKLGLQEMRFTEVFDAIICIDAMELVPAEDWPLVLQNFQRALKPDGYLYFTVEVIDAGELQEALRAARDQGLPVVEGEWAPDDRYHYYPKMDQVRAWVQAARFAILEEAVGDDYHHFLARKV